MLFRRAVGPLWPHARARDAVSEGRPGLGRAHRLGPRPGAQLAADRLRHPSSPRGLAGGLIWQATRGTVVPWVVQVDKLGQAQAVAPADRRLPAHRSADRLASRALHRGRSLASRPIRSSCARTGSRPTTSPPTRAPLALNDYARANDPFAKIGKQQVAVEISSVIRASHDSFRVAWIERRYENGASPPPSAGPPSSPS